MKRNAVEMGEEYTTEQIHSGVRGKYLGRYQEGVHIVQIAPDVAAVYRTEDEVNEALRSLFPTQKSVESAA